MPRTTTKPAADLAYLCRALKAPSLAAAIERMGERARAEGWTPRGVSRRLPRARGGRPPVERWRDPRPGRPVPGSRKTLEDFDFDHQRSLKRETHLAPRHARLHRREGRTSSSSGRPGPERPICRPASASGPARPATGSLSPPRPSGSPGSATLIDEGRLHDELSRLGRIPLLVIDEVGYIPFDGEAANLFFQLISSRYERASVIVTSNKPFGRWGEVFGRPRCRRRDDRPPRPSRRGREPERRQLPTEGPRPREDGDERRELNHQDLRGGSIFGRRRGVKIQPSLTRSRPMCRRSLRLSDHPLTDPLTTTGRSHARRPLRMPTTVPSSLSEVPAPDRSAPFAPSGARIGRSQRGRGKGGQVARQERR